jgi:sec-independent protein translocase protein TatB
MDFSWSELLIVGIVALIVIGPKDLPGMFRELGRFTAKIRAMGREFSRAMEQAAKETGVQDVANDLRKATSPKAMGLDAVRSAAEKFEKWDPLKPAAGAGVKPAAAPPTPPPMPATPVPAPVAAMPAVGPATAALAEDVAAKRAAASEVTARLRASKAASALPSTPASSPAPVAEAAPAKPRGRVRKKPDTGASDAT